MKFTIIVSSSPNTENNRHTAVEFTRALLTKQHTLNALFFIQDGVYTSLHTAFYTSENIWENLSNSFNIPLKLCSASLFKRRIDPSCINPIFHLAGLGELIEACLNSDKIITFRSGIQ